MPTFQELIRQQQDPAAIRLRTALEVYAARAKAEAHLTTVSRALDDAKQQEEQARIIRDDLLADLAHRLDDLAEDDVIGRAHLALDLAEINDAYRPAANDLCRAEDALADALRALRIAEHEAAKYPLPAPNP